MFAIIVTDHWSCGINVVGPFASRDEAEATLRRLQSLDEWYQNVTVGESIIELRNKEMARARAKARDDGEEMAK